MRQPAISKHLRVSGAGRGSSTGEAGPVAATSTGAGPLRDIADWVGPRYQHHWEKKASNRLEHVLPATYRIWRRTGTMETTMSPTGGSTRGSTDTTTIYSEGGRPRLERTFDAPREPSGRAMTERDRVRSGGARRTPTTKVVELDVRPGGCVENSWAGPRPRQRELLRRVSLFQETQRLRGGRFVFDVDAASGRSAGRRPLALEDLRGPPSQGEPGVRGTWAPPTPWEGPSAETGPVVAKGALRTWDRLADLLAEG